MTEVVIALTVFLLGLWAGFCIAGLGRNKIDKYSGSFVIDLSDPMKDICRLELEEDLDSIYSKQHIRLLVKTIGDDSQE